MPIVLTLIKELADYEKEANQVKTSVGELVQDGFCENPLFKVVCADFDGEVVGMVLYYYGYSTWKGKMVYIDDIVVSERFRRMGVGQKLFDYIRKEAKEKNANQIRFHVLEWNEPAINFYKKNGTSLDEDWVLCKLENEDM